MRSPRSADSPLGPQLYPRAHVSVDAHALFMNASIASTPILHKVETAFLRELLVFFRSPTERARRRGFAKRSFAPPRRRAPSSARLCTGGGARCTVVTSPQVPPLHGRTERIAQ